MSDSNKTDSQNNSGESPNGATQAPNDGGASDLQTQVEKHKNDFLYLKAEFENYKRNAIKERSELLKFAGEKVLSELISVVDNFDRALETKVTPENLPTYQKGIEMTAQELKSLLIKFGVTEIPSAGTAFNPQFHEALSSEETDATPEGHIHRVFKKAYKIHDKLLRPGQVVVAKKPVVN